MRVPGRVFFSFFIFFQSSALADLYSRDSIGLAGIIIDDDIGSLAIIESDRAHEQYLVPIGGRVSRRYVITSITENGISLASGTGHINLRIGENLHPADDTMNMSQWTSCQHAFSKLILNRDLRISSGDYPGAVQIKSKVEKDVYDMGLRQNDIITHFSGHAPSDLNYKLLHILFSDSKEVSLNIVREGKVRTLIVRNDR